MGGGDGGRGLHSSTSQLNLSCFCHQTHPEYPLVTPSYPLLPPDTSYTPPKQPLDSPPIPQKAITLSRKVDECKPLDGGVPAVAGAAGAAGAVGRTSAGGRGLHSSTYQLNLSRF